MQIHLKHPLNSNKIHPTIKDVKYVLRRTTLICVLLLSTMRGSLGKESTTKTSANVQLLRSPQNQSVPEGEDVRFYCVPEGLVKYVIWYFQPNSLRINQTTTAHTDALSMESMEIALCQPNAICKEKSILKNVKVYPEGLLVVSQVTSQNAGKFECAIVAGVHTSRSHAYLFVEAQPGVPAVNAIEGRNSLSRFKEGDSLSLVCTCDSGHPKPTLHWTQSVEEHPDRSKHIRQLTAEDSRITFFQSHSDAISHLVHLGLQLTLSWEDDQSELRCNAVNRIGNSSSKPVSLSVEFAPRIQAFAYNPWIISASKITEILCNAIANPPPMLEWFTWHGRRFSELPRVQSSLVVDEFEQDRNESLIAGWRANITCVATNHIGANYLTLPVEYQFAPVVSTNNIVYAHLGQSIQLHCNVVANPPATRIFWYRVPTGATSSVSSIEKTIENSSSSPEIDTSESLYNPILRIDSLSTSDSGEYICKAENEINASGEIPIYQSSKSSSFLRVYYPPGKPSLEPSGERQMAVGSRLQFKCQSNTQTPGLPDPKFKWMWRPRSCKGLLELREKHIVNSESKNEMVLDELENKDDGLYYCKVYNDLGEVLSAPTSLSVLNPAEIILSSPPHISYELSATLDTKSPTLFCVARGKPIPKIHWTRNGARLDSKPKEDVTLIDSSLKTNEKSDCIVLHDNSFVWQIRSELRWQSAQGNHPLRNSPPRQNHHLSVDDEGQYICEAHDIQGHVDKAAVTLKLYYLPKLLHAQLIKQSLGKIVTISEERPTNALLSDHGTIYERTSVRSTAQFNLSCYLRAVPPPTRVVWELLPDSPNSNCAEDSEYTSADCASCPRGKQIAVYREQGTIREDKSKVTLLTGVAAKRYMDWKLNKEVTPFTESAAITQLVFQSGLIPRAGLYAAHIKNRHGCTTCLVNLGNYTALPEAPSMIQLLETKPHALLISWLPGFDGGSTQQLYFHVTYMTSEAKYELPANKDGRANHTRVFVVKLVPKLPNTCRCWLPGLYPDTTYWISAHSANTIGKSPMSETLVAKTARSPFPRIKQVRFFDTKLQIYLENDSVIQSYCLQVEKSTQGATNWVHIYTDCPAVATHSSTSSLELVPEWCENDSIFLVRQVADQYRHAADSSVRISHRFVTVQEGSRSAKRAYTNIDIETPPGDPTEHKAFQYRLRTCLSHLPTVCSSSTLFNVLNSKRDKGYAFIFGAAFFGILIPSLCSMIIFVIFNWWRKRKFTKTGKAVNTFSVQIDGKSLDKPKLMKQKGKCCHANFPKLNQETDLTRNPTESHVLNQNTVKKADYQQTPNEVKTSSNNPLQVLVTPGHTDSILLCTALVHDPLEHCLGSSMLGPELKMCPTNNADQNGALSPVSVYNLTNGINGIAGAPLILFPAASFEKLQVSSACANENLPLLLHSPVNPKCFAMNGDNPWLRSKTWNYQIPNRKTNFLEESTSL